MIIRRALTAEIPTIVEMGRHFLAASPFVDVIPDSTVHMRALATQLLACGAQGTILVADIAEGEGLMGMVGLTCTPHFLSGELTAGEVFFWVEPRARGIVGVRLIQAAEQWAKDSGAVAIQMIAPDARVGTFYNRRKYRAIETTYWKRL